MKKKHFRCDVKEFDCKAECCKSISTKPVLGVGDFIRIREHTGELVSKIWLEKGNTRLVYIPEQWGENNLLLTLGLIHEPCPYVSQDDSCKIYEARPLVCANFPFSLSHSKRMANYSNLGCMNGNISQKQKEYSRKIKAVMKSEMRLDREFFWTKGPQLFRFKTVSDICKIAEKLEGLLEKNGSWVTDIRRQDALKAFSELDEILKNVASSKAAISTQELGSIMEPILFVYLGECIAEQLENVAKARKHEYHETTREYYKILNR